MSQPTGPRFEGTSYDFTPFNDCQNWIGGEWVAATTGESQAIVNPRHGQVMGRVVVGGPADVDAAVTAAKAAFPAWRATPMRERAQVLYRVKQIMERDVEELAWLLCHENGKLYGEAKGSVDKAIECLEMGCSLANMMVGGQLDVSRGVRCEVSYEPLGVVAGVVPFNFPTMVPMWMLPQALVSGNTFVLKPSEKVPYGAQKLAHIFKEAGLPDGVLNLVNGTQSTVEAICDHPDIKAIGFVGSTKVAKIVYARGAATGKRVLALGGAKNHLVLVNDAELELASENIPASAFGCAGQRCMAASVLVAVGDVDQYIARIVEITSGMEMGKDIGPVIDQAAVDRITRYVDDAEKRGVKILVDGRGKKGPGNGFWFGPTILDGVTADMPAGCEEVFGPVLSIIRVDTLDEALRVENKSPYGNAAAIFTSNGHTARYAIERFQAGMCGVNIGVPVPREPFAFGGWNDSKFGHGDLTGEDGFRFWTNPRKVTTKWAKQPDQTWMG